MANYLQIFIVWPSTAAIFWGWNFYNLFITNSCLKFQTISNLLLITSCTLTPSIDRLGFWLIETNFFYFQKQYWVIINSNLYKLVIFCGSIKVVSVFVRFWPKPIKSVWFSCRSPLLQLNSNVRSWPLPIASWGRTLVKR